MAAETPNIDLSKFYDQSDPPISDLTRAILTSNGIPEDQIVPHIRTVVRTTRPYCLIHTNYLRRETKAGNR